MINVLYTKIWKKYIMDMHMQKRLDLVGQNQTSHTYELWDSLIHITGLWDPFIHTNGSSNHTIFNIETVRWVLMTDSIAQEPQHNRIFINLGSYTLSHIYCLWPFLLTVIIFSKSTLTEYQMKHNPIIANFIIQDWIETTSIEYLWYFRLKSFENKT